MIRTIFALGTRELFRARVPHAAALFVAALIVASFFAGSLTFESAPDVALDFALTGAAIFAASLAIILGLEIAGGAATPRFHPFLAAGARRETVLGGLIASAAVSAIFFAALPPLCLLAAFGSGASSAPILPDLRAACILLPMEAVILVAFSTLLAVSVSRPIALALSFAIWIACHLHPDPLTFEIIYPGASGELLRWVGKLLPDLELYNPRVYAENFGESVRAAALQCAFYSAAAVAAAMAVFKRKDLL